MGLFNFNKKSLGRDPEQTRIIIGQEYTSDLLLDDQNDYSRISKFGFRMNADAYGAVDKVSKSIALLEYRVFEKMPNGDKKYINNHPFLDLIQRPNPDRGKYQYMYELVLFLLLSGMTFQRKILVGGTPKRLYVSNPNNIGMELQKNKQVGWYFDYNGEKNYYKNDEISYLKFTDPLDDFRGLSPLKAAAYNIDGTNEANKLNYSMLRNGGKPSGVLTTKQSFSNDLDALKRLKGMVKKLLTGNSYGQDLILENGLEYKQLSLSPKDMDSMNYLELNARKVCQVLGVPIVLLDTTQNSNYNSFVEAKKALYTETTLPLAQLIVDEWNNWLLPAYGEGYYVEIDKSKIDVLQEGADLVSERTIAQYRSGIITRAEAREKLGLPRIEEDNIFFVGTDVFVAREEALKEAVDATPKKNFDLFTDIKKELMELEKKAAQEVLSDEEIEKILDKLDSDDFNKEVLSLYTVLIQGEGQRVITDVLNADELFIFSDEITKYITETTLKNSKIIIDETLREKIRKIIIENNVVGKLNPKKIKDQITKMFKKEYLVTPDPDHLDSVVRTEVGIAFSVTNNAAYKQMKVPFKGWLPTADERTRGSHQALAPITIIPFDAKFTTGLGNEALFPRDPELPAADIINCRCGFTPEFSAEKSTYPTEKKQDDFVNKQLEAMDSYLPAFMEGFDKAFNLQLKAIVRAVDDIVGNN